MLSQILPSLLANYTGLANDLTFLMCFGNGLFNAWLGYMFGKGAGAPTCWYLLAVIPVTDYFRVDDPSIMFMLLGLI